MNFILFFIFRKLYMRLELSDDMLVFHKGIFFRRVHSIPLCSVVRITVRRSVFLRIFRLKEAEIFTLNGRFKLLLRRDDKIPAFGISPARFTKPSFLKIAFGAFIDVRALGAVAVFAAVLRRIGAIFGGKYLDNILDMLDTAAVTFEQAFSAMRVYVPKAAAALAVFALAAWGSAYLRKLAALSRFRVGRRGRYIIVESGLLTLYEHTLVRNYAAAVVPNSILSLAAKRSPLYLRGVMICPSAKRHELVNIMRDLCGIRLGAARKAVPPRSAVFGYCAAPLTWTGIFAALLTLLYISDILRGAMLLKTALYCGLFVSLYSSAVCLFYIKHSGTAFGKRFCAVSARRFLRLNTAVFRNDGITAEKLSQSFFQRSSGLCNLKISTVERRRFKARLLPLDKVNRDL